MKIGMVCPYNMLHAGGVQEVVVAMQRELNARGHVVTIITPRPRGHADEVPPGTVFIGQSQRIRTPLGTSDDIAVSVNTSVIDEVLDAHMFDIIHIHEPLVPFLSFQMLPRIKCPVVGTFHAAMPENILAKTIAGSIKPYVRLILKNLDTITAVSPAATSYIESYKHHKITFVPNGIDLSLYKPQAAPPRKNKSIVYVGRLEPRKGVQCLLKSFAELAPQHPELSLEIAGNGPERDKLEKLVMDEAIPRVTFHGFVSEAEKLRLLSRASLFCSPALYGESFGIVLLEAMAMGVPIVAGDNPGYASVLEGRGQISLVNPEDTAAFARQLELMIYDEHLRAGWQEWAAETVPQYTYSKVIDQYEAIYFSLRMATEPA